MPLKPLRPKLIKIAIGIIAAVVIYLAACIIYGFTTLLPATESVCNSKSKFRIFDSSPEGNITLTSFGIPFATGLVVPKGIAYDSDFSPTVIIECVRADTKAFAVILFGKRGGIRCAREYHANPSGGFTFIAESNIATPNAA